MMKALRGFRLRIGHHSANLFAVRKNADINKNLPGVTFSVASLSNMTGFDGRSVRRKTLVNGGGQVIST